MSFEEILEHATTDALLYIDDQEFNVAGIEKVKLATGDHVLWLWGTDGSWLIVDHDGDELIFLQPAEEEVVEEDDFVTYLGTSYEETELDSGSLQEVEGEVEHEAGDGFEFKQFESEKGALARALTWTGYGEELWYCGRMMEEDDVRVA